MGTVPAWLLRHRMTIRPYLGTWGSYGAAGTPQRCQAQEKINTSAQQAGVVRTTTLTVVALPTVSCPEGSLVTVTDPNSGRTWVGYASAVAVHTAPGLPTPDHTEIAIAVAGSNYGAPLGGETVTILRRVKLPDPDRYGNARYSTTETSVAGCAIRPLGSDERDAGSRDQTRDEIEVIVPPGTTVDRSARLRVRGLVYEVNGTPGIVRDPMTGAEGGTQLIGQRTVG